MNRQQSNMIPGGQPNQAMQMMQNYAQFRKQFYEQNQNPDPKAAFDQFVMQNGLNNQQIQQAMNIAQMFGFRFN